MSRPKKKPNYNPDQVMQEFMAAVADAFGSYDEYYGAAEPPVRCGESHLSGLTEPPIDSYSA